MRYFSLFCANLSGLGRRVGRAVGVSLLGAGLLSACATSSLNEPVGAGYYRVQPGDTLYRIANNNGQSVSNLVRWNSLADASTINVGQVLRVLPPTGSASTSEPRTTTRTKPSSRTSTVNAPSPSTVSMFWPATGNKTIIRGFNGTSSKGIDISGSAGDPVVAIAAGKVVYAGQGIRNYGNLLVIKHDNEFLSAYAHNQTLLVKEGARVSQGQKVATMGQTGTDRVKLHFELRYRGQSIDPKGYLSEP